MPDKPPAPKPSQRPRYRYVLVRFKDPPSGFTRQDAIDALRGVAAGGEPPWLTRFNREFGILRVIRGRERAAVEALRAPLVLPRGMGEIHVETISTSGSIAALHRHHPAVAFPR